MKQPAIDLSIEVVHVDKLTPDPRNARKHGEKNLAAIAESLTRFGQRRPLVVTEDYVVAAGNGTLAAAVSLGWTEVAVTVFPGSPDEALAYALVDNRTAELAEWDGEVLTEQLLELGDLGWDMDSLGFAGLAASTDDVVEDDPDALGDKQPICAPGDVWQLGPHLVVCGDATNIHDIRAATGERRVDLAFTDPPYGVAYVGGGGLTIANDDLDEPALLELLQGAFVNLFTELRPGAPFYICSPSGHLETTFRRALQNAGLRLRQQLVWVKNAHVMGRSDYHLRHESILYGWVDGGFPTPIGDLTELESLPDLTALYSSEHETLLYGWQEGAAHEWAGGRRQNTVWEFPKPKKSTEHPTMKPVTLVARAILNSTKPGGLVLDSFAGSGSTLIACQQTGRQAALVELDPRYVDVICRRWQRFTGQLPVHAKTDRAVSFVPDTRIADG